ncbi:unnamed protein product [Cunninghamella echinulata]
MSMIYNQDERSSFSNSSQSRSFTSDIDFYTNEPLPSIQQYDANSIMKTHAFNDDDLAMIENLNYDDIDEGLIEQEREYQKRESFINQLLTTEQAYSESLDLVINVFLKPLVKNSKQTSFNFLGTQKVVCTEREIKWLFGNFEAIVEVHHTILTSLKKRLQHWGPTQIISDVFQSWFPLLDVYHLYFQNYGVAMTTYERLTNYQPFKKFIDNAHKNKSLKGATLPSLLQIPAGCIQRYDSIISGLASHTYVTHPDYNALISCKQRINKFAKDIFPRINETDNIDQVIMIQQALIGAPFGVNSRRRLILQGNLSRVVAPTKSVGEERTYILFSDLLVFVRPRQEQQKTTLQYKGHIPLEQARVRVLPESETGGQPFCIEIASSIRGVDNIQSTYVGNSSTHVLHTSSLEEQELWLRKLEYVIARIDRHAARLKAEETRRRNENRSPPQSLHRVGSSSITSVTSSSSNSSGKSVK